MRMPAQQPDDLVLTRLAALAPLTAGDQARINDAVPLALLFRHGAISLARASGSRARACWSMAGRFGRTWCRTGIGRSSVWCFPAS